MALDIRQGEKRVLLLAIQSALGVAAALSGATDAQQVLDGDFKFLADQLQREVDSQGHGSKPYVHVKPMCNYTGGLELRGAAVVGAAMPGARVLRICGFQETLVASTSATYALRIANWEYGTMEGYDGGSCVAAINCQGVLKKLMYKVGEYSKAEFDIKGANPPRGTAVGATTNATGYAAGVTSITLAAAGTGTLLVGDVIQFAGDTRNTYRVGTAVANVSAGGAVTISPALVTAIPASATAITVKLPQIFDANNPNAVLTAFISPEPITTESGLFRYGATELNAIEMEIDTNADAAVIEGTRDRIPVMSELYQPSGSVTVTKEYRGDFDPEQLALAHTANDMVFEVVGGGEKQRITLKGVQLGIPEPTLIENIVHWKIPFIARGTNTTDCLTIAFLLPNAV